MTESVEGASGCGDGCWTWLMPQVFLSEGYQGRLGRHRKQTAWEKARAQPSRRYCQASPSGWAGNSGRCCRLRRFAVVSDILSHTQAEYLRPVCQSACSVVHVGAYPESQARDAQDDTALPVLMGPRCGPNGRITKLLVRARCDAFTTLSNVLPKGENPAGPRGPYDGVEFRRNTRARHRWYVWD